MMVFCDNLRGFFSLGVKLRTKGFYGHFMWFIGPYSIASQQAYFKHVDLKSHENYAMKLVYNPNWTEEQKQLLLGLITIDLRKPWYKTMYDCVGIVGELLGWSWLNLKKLSFCSERGIYLSAVDPELDVTGVITPSELNAFTKARPDRYQVYGRYTPD